MPTITISHKDLNKLVGKPIPIKMLSEEAILHVKGEIESIQGDELKIEIAETNRPELWSTEGIARELRARYGKDTGVPNYTVAKAKIEVIVNPNLAKIRPYTVCAVIRGVDLNDDALGQLIQLQEKICDTYGRKRRDVAIGVYDLHKITPPIEFKAVNPDSLKFIPLEFKSERTLRQILDEHPKGKEYGHLLKEHSAYPIFIDKKGEVLSMPPIINSNHTGRVTEKTKDLFIECSGFDYDMLMPALCIMASALAERKGSIEAVKIRQGTKTITTPDFTSKKINVSHSSIEKMAGMKLTQAEILNLLKRARYNARAKTGTYECEYPAYRQDIMHPVDVIEDILIAYGYHNIVPELPKIPFQGAVRPQERFCRSIAELLVGQGAQEIISYTLTNENAIFDKMRKKRGPLIRIENAVSQNWSVFRTWLIPSLMDFLSQNTRSEYPQKIFEVGRVVLFDEKAETRSLDPLCVAFASASLDADFTKAKQALEAVLFSVNASAAYQPIDHDSFVQGRVASIKIQDKTIGLVGELHPAVLAKWGILVPVCTFEINLDALYEVVSCREKSK